MAKLKLKLGPDIKVLKQGFTVDRLLRNQAACIGTMIAHDQRQAIDAGVKESEIVTFSYEDQGLASPMDGLYVLETRLKDKAFADRTAKFLHATVTGWNDAVKNPVAFERTVKVLLAAGSAPVIKKNPGKAAFTHSVREAASKP